MLTREIFKGKNILLVLLGVLFLSLALQKIITTDLFFHIKSGNDMLQAGRIIDKNIYSFAADNYEYSNHAWASKVIFAAVYNWFGIYGINVLMVLLLTAVFARIFLFLGRTRYFNYYYLLVVIGLILSAMRFQARPQLFSLLFFSVYLQILLSYVNNKHKRLIMLIVPLQYVWNNMHAYSIMGLFVVGCFVVDQMVRSLMRDRIRHHRTHVLRLFFEKNTLSLVAVFLLQIITYFLMYRQDLFFRMYLQLFGDYRRFCFTLIEEFLPVGLTSTLLMIMIFVGITSPLIMRFRKSGDYARFVICVVLLLLTLKVSRNIDYLVIAILTFTGFELQPSRAKGAFLKYLKALDSKNSYLKGALIACSCLLIFSELALANMQVTGFGVNELAVPVALGDFLAQNDIAGNGYNEFAEGSYLIYKKHPKKKVYIHNQVEAYPPANFDEYMLCYENKNAMTRLINKYGITHAIVNLKRRSENMIRWFSVSKMWRLIYFDGLYFVFVKDNEANKALTDKYNITDDPEPPSTERTLAVLNKIRYVTPFEKLWFSLSGYSQLGYTCGKKEGLLSYRRSLGFLSLHYYNKAEKELLNTLELAPWDVAAIEALIRLYGKTKKAERIALIRKMIDERLSSNPRFLFVCAQAFINAGDGAASTKILDELAGKKINKAFIEKARGDLSLYEGQFAAAAAHYEEALRDNSADRSIYSALGKVYFLMGELEKARVVLEEHLIISNETIDDMMVLADVYSGLNLHADAQRMYEKVLEYDLFNEKARAFLRSKK